jgi:hypothetical protein
MPVKRIPIFLAIILLLPLKSWSQIDSITHIYRQAPILKFSHFSLLDPISSIQFAVEHKVGNRVSLQHEAGVIMPLLHRLNNFNDQRGIRLRNELRFYVNPLGNQLRGLYLAPEGLYLHQRGQKIGEFGKDCGEGIWDCASYQREEYTRLRNVYAFHLKLGIQEFRQRGVLDVYWGIGFRHTRVRDINRSENDAFEMRGWNLFNTDPGNYNLPGISLGFKLGYLLHAPTQKREEGI